MNALDNIELMKKTDKDNMLALVDKFPSMIEETISICSRYSFNLSKDIDNIVIAGMGGSAIGGDILKKVLENMIDIPIAVIRNYSIPKYVGRKTLFFALSYSGDTEETLAAYDSANECGAQIVVVTSGGQIEEQAVKNSHVVVNIPSGLPPRASTPYLLTPMIYIMEKAGFVKGLMRQMDNAAGILNGMREKYRSSVPYDNNYAKQLACKLQNKIPLIFGSLHGSDVASYRWKTQFSENSKITAMSNSFPELNHNEIVNLAELNASSHQFALILLRDKQEAERIQKRIEITKEIIAPSINDIYEIWAEGSSQLETILSLSYFGDYVSVYLAIVNETDPTPVLSIDALKKELAN